VNSFFTLEFVHFLRALHFGSNAYKSVLTQYFKIYVLYYLCTARLELAVTFRLVASQLSRRQSPCMFLEKLNKMNRRKYFQSFSICFEVNSLFESDFPKLNLINNIVNNIRFILLSVVVDVLLYRFSK
jgi:hypothetical protein